MQNTWNNFCDKMDAVRAEQAKLAKKNEAMRLKVQAEIRQIMANKRVDKPTV
jgi:hypothetical protein